MLLHAGERSPAERSSTDRDHSPALAEFEAPISDTSAMKSAGRAGRAASPHEWYARIAAMAALALAWESPGKSASRTLPTFD